MEDGALIPNATGRARPTHSSFRRVSAVLTAVLLTCTPEAPWVSTPVSCLLTDLSAMAGFRPDSFRCFGTVSCAQLRSSGFPFLLRRYLQKHAPATVHRMAYSEIFTAKKYILRFPWLLYTIYPQFASNSAPLCKIFCVSTSPEDPCALPFVLRRSLLTA